RTHARHRVDPRNSPAKRSDLADLVRDARSRSGLTRFRRAKLDRAHAAESSRETRSVRRLARSLGRLRSVAPRSLLLLALITGICAGVARRVVRNPVRRRELDTWYAAVR